MGFEDHGNPNHVFKLRITLYRLKQAPRAWHERLSGFFYYQIRIQLWESRNHFVYKT